jgi:mono/diheme cytochrome c family protein
LLALAWPRGHRWPTAIVALLAAFLVLGSYERLREGLRKPFVIRDYMFSNGIRVDQIAKLNETGLLAASGWSAREAQGGELAGKALFRRECSACHTMNGYLPMRRILAGADPDRVNGLIGLMRADGDAWIAARQSGAASPNPDQLTYAFMPPFVGTEEEASALGMYLLQEIGVRVAQAPPMDGDRIGSPAAVEAAVASVSGGGR